MMRSLSSAVGGLRAHQTKMDVIGTNIANVNTYGFKSSRVTFSDVYYQTLNNASAPTATTGGTNPTQIGYGAAVATIDVMNTQSGLASTDRAMDIYINGDGMIATKDVNGNLLYSRLGILGFDADGNLVDANGNFVMGFPMNEATGVPIVNPDGTCDIDDLSRIKVLPEMLDQLTGISIGPNGEIIGTMPGDVTTSVNKKKPDWLSDVIVAADSNIVGDIKVTMEWRSEGSISGLAADWISSIECQANSRVVGDYEFSYFNGAITARNLVTNEVLTGTYKKGSVVDLTNAKGQVVMSITTDKYNEPPKNMTNEMVLGVVNFQEKLMLCVEATDKGGNKVTSEIEYNGVTREITMLDGEITLIIDPDATLTATTMTLNYNNDPITNPFQGDWLNSVYLEPSATYSGNSLKLRAGVSQTVNALYSGNNALNFITEKGKVEELIKDLNIKGAYTISTESIGPNLSDGFKLVIKASNGTTIESEPITEAGQNVEFNYTPAGGTPTTYVLGTIRPEQFKQTAVAVPGLTASEVKRMLDAIGVSEMGEYSIVVSGTAATLTGPDGTQYNAAVTDGQPIEFTINGTTFNIGTYSTGMFASPTVIGKCDQGLNLSNSSFSNLSESNVLQLIADDNTILEEVQYNGSTTITLGDVSLKVDKSALEAYFAGRPILEDNEINLGGISRNTEPDWAYDNNVANAQPGIGEAYTIGNIAVAKIPNMVAMEQNGQSYFTVTANSGEATFCKPGISGTGTLKAGYLEMSNVDISKEFTDMITTQRGFQANTRIITVSDEMLQELVNLKR